jgi:hypothetical protein
MDLAREMQAYVLDGLEQREASTPTLKTARRGLEVD